MTKFSKGLEDVVFKIKEEYKNLSGLGNSVLLQLNGKYMGFVFCVPFFCMYKPIHTQLRRKINDIIKYKK